MSLMSLLPFLGLKVNEIIGGCIGIENTNYIQN